MSTVHQQLTKSITLQGSAQIVMDFFHFGINNILFQRGLYPQEDFAHVHRYGLNLLSVTDEAVVAYIAKVLAQISRWIETRRISKLVLVISSKATGEPLERWSFDIELEDDNDNDDNSQKENENENDIMDTDTPGDSVHDTQGSTTQEPQRPPFGSSNPFAAGRNVSLRPILSDGSSSMVSAGGRVFGRPANTQTPVQQKGAKSMKQINAEISSVMRQITASVSFLPVLDQECTFNVLVYVDRDVETSVDWVDSDAKMVDNAEQVKLRNFSTSVHKVGGLVSYKVVDDFDI